jgi:hypothetical protein
MSMSNKIKICNQLSHRPINLVYIQILTRQYRSCLYIRSYCRTFPFIWSDYWIVRGMMIPLIDTEIVRIMKQQSSFKYNGGNANTPHSEEVA